MRQLLLFLLLLFTMPVLAIDAPVHFDDPAKAELYDDMLEEIRCLVCQNQSLADSSAELAQDLRHEIIEMIDAGNDEQYIKNFLVERYGDFILYRPPLQENTWLLWLGPFLFLATGFVVAILIIKRQSSSQTGAVQLTPEQEQAIRKMNADNKEEQQ